MLRAEGSPQELAERKNILKKEWHIFYRLYEAGAKADNTGKGKLVIIERFERF